eukprot:209901_1
MQNIMLSSVNNWNRSIQTTHGINRQQSQPPSNTQTIQSSNNCTSRSIDLINNLLTFIEKYSNCLKAWSWYLGSSYPMLEVPYPHPNDRTEKDRFEFFQFININNSNGVNNSTDICQECRCCGNGRIDKNDNLFYCSSCWDNYNNDLSPIIVWKTINDFTEFSLHDCDIEIPQAILDFNKRFLDCNKRELSTHPEHLNKNMISYVQSTILKESELIIWNWIRLLNLTGVETTLVYWIAEFANNDYDSNLLPFRSFNNLLLQQFSGDKLKEMKLNQTLFFQTFLDYLSSINVIKQRIDTIYQITIEWTLTGGYNYQAKKVSETVTLFANGYYKYTKYNIPVGWGCSCPAELCGCICPAESKHAGLWNWASSCYWNIDLCGYGYNTTTQVNKYVDTHIQLFKINHLVAMDFRIQWFDHMTKFANIKVYYA